MQYKKRCGPQQPLSAKCSSKSCCHLHSTDIPFCDALDIDGSASVNITAAVMELDEGEEEEEDVAAPEKKEEHTCSLLKSGDVTGFKFLPPPLPHNHGCSLERLAK